MQEERTEDQEQEEPEEDGVASEVDDPSLEEDQPEEEPAAADEEESQPVDEDEEETGSTEEAESEDLVEEEPARRHGCMVGCLTPVIVGSVIVAVIFIIGYSKRDALSHGLLNRIIANTQEDVLTQIDVLSNLPTGMDKDRIITTFEKVEFALKEGRMDREALTEIIEEYWDSERKEQAVVQLITSLDEVITGTTLSLMQRTEM